MTPTLQELQAELAKFVVNVPVPQAIQPVPTVNQDEATELLRKLIREELLNTGVVAAPEVEPTIIPLPELISTDLLGLLGKGLAGWLGEESGQQALNEFTRYIKEMK